MKSIESSTIHVQRSGFSMIEVIVSVAIIGILAAVAAPRLGRGLNAYQIEAAAERVAADLRLITEYSRNRGNSQTITVYPDRNSYSFSGLSVNGQNEPYVVELSAAPYEAGIQSVTPESGRVTVDGFGFPGETLTVVLSVGDFLRTVRLEAATGRVFVTGD